MGENPDHHLMVSASDLELALAAHSIAYTAKITPSLGWFTLRFKTPEAQMLLLKPFPDGGGNISMRIEIALPLEKRIKHPARKRHHKEIAPKLEAIGMVRAEFEYGHVDAQSCDYAIGAWEGQASGPEEAARMIVRLAEIPDFIDLVEGAAR